MPQGHCLGVELEATINRASRKRVFASHWKEIVGCGCQLNRSSQHPLTSTSDRTFQKTLIFWATLN